MAARKAVKKATSRVENRVDKSSGKSSRRGRVGQLADHPEMRGRGPKKGAPNAGRPPNAFKARMQALADRAAQTLEVERILEQPDHPLFAQAMKHVTEHGYGKPDQAQRLDADVTFRVVFE